jgi:myeloid zinc finger protein 1
VFKNGSTPTLWPQDVPYPPDGGKDDAPHQPHDFSNIGANEEQYSAYFKDTKGVQHSVFGGNLSALQYLKQGKDGGQLPDLLQQPQPGANRGMPLYVR